MDLFYYLDGSGQEHGPFSADQMNSWYWQGYFSDIKVRRSGDACWYSLSSGVPSSVEFISSPPRHDSEARPGTSSCDLSQYWAWFTWFGYYYYLHPCQRENEKVE
eukprot:TRINITY_DN12054_c1_g1_i3.p1 TRINITY_DN12054_c1_g1~~TRINITY_DN12054_c1_g1_i3.p1  ORF type:complete len:105 (-),score=19.69 TRINITY_DN12054_c1_g1_i3:50-364(-)